MKQQYEVIMMCGGAETIVFDVEASRHQIEKPETKSGAGSFSNEAPLFIVFYRTTDAAADADTSEPGTLPELEVFRAPVHALLAVRLVDEDDDE